MRYKIKRLKFPPLGAESLIGQEVEVKGWVKTLRRQKNFSFIEINDGSTLSNMQVIAEEGLPGYEEMVDRLTNGCSAAVRGVLAQHPEKKSVEIRAKEIKLIGDCDPESYPLQKKRHSFEFLRTIAHLRPRTNTLGAVTRTANALAYATHRYFQERGFLWIRTPIITASDCEGAGKLFQVSTLDLEDPALKEGGGVDYQKDFFERPSYLTVSGQLNAEVYASALSDVYTFGPTFRAENSNTSRHLAEFWMIEPEMAFADINDNMDSAEEYLKYVIRALLDECPEDMAFFDKYISKGLIERLQKLIETPFERATYSYAVRVLEKAARPFQYPVKWGVDLQAEHERYLVEEYFSKPLIITDYPKQIKAFYMRENDDEKTVAAMDLCVPRVGELIGGSQREERLDRIELKMEQAGLSTEDYWWYLELRKYGSVPHAGYGVGFERLVQFCTGMDNIRDAIPFPRYPGKADF